jgi:hypothetical protein
VSRRLRNEFVEESDELDYRFSYRNPNDRKRTRSADVESPRGRSKIRTKRERKSLDDY